jgi:hypothetical protein
LLSLDIVNTSMNQYAGFERGQLCSVVRVCRIVTRFDCLFGGGPQHGPQACLTISGSRDSGVAKVATAARGGSRSTASSATLPPRAILSDI